MQFYIEHDWQENMAAPRAKVGERAKTHMLIFLCAVWLCVGLIGHSPWKPFESQSMSVIQGLIEHPFLSASSWLHGDWIAPVSAGHPALETPPLFYWVAAGFVHLFSGLLPAHDAARLSIGVWMLLTLMMVGLTGRELWNKGVGRQTNFIFIGCIGLVVSAHTLMPAIAGLSGLAMAFYGLALVLRKPLRATMFIALGLMISFLSSGILAAMIVCCTALLLLLLCPAWRQPGIATAILAALCLAMPAIVLWCGLCQHWAPAQWQHFLSTQWQPHESSQHWYFMRTLAWFAWPALPLACWGLWRFRHQLFSTYRFQLCLVAFFTAFALIGVFADRNESHTLPLLIPLTALAAGSIETLKRGASGALNWFALILFGILMGIAWLGWWSMLNGHPQKLYERLSYLSGLKTINFNLFYGAIAIAVTLLWFSTVLRSKHSNRSSATNWAIGMTCTWTIFMSLWLPMIDAARTYQPVFATLRAQLPAKFNCIYRRNIGSAQIDLLHYHAGLRTVAYQENDSQGCTLFLIADEPGKRHTSPGAEWQLR
ncbi:MAG TPA: glycosyl transferase, partial [Methylophilus sp.]